MAEGDDVGAEPGDHLVHGAAAVPAAQVAAVIGLFLEKSVAGGVVKVRPVDPPPAEPFAERLNRAQKLTLLDGERAHGEFDRRALFEQQQRIEQRHRILAPGKPNGHTIAFADHVEAANGFPDFVEQGLFEYQPSIIAGRRYADFTNSFTLCVAVGNRSSPTPSTSSAIVRYKSPIVPVVRVCRPVRIEPTCPATIIDKPVVLVAFASACSCT